MEWGDAEAMKALLREIAEGTELGKAIGNGAVATGKYTRPPPRARHAKGQAIPAWDPRPLKATGVTYATSPMGADHTAGLIVNPGLRRTSSRTASQKAQLVNAVCDSSGFCQFLQPTLDDIRAFYGALYGHEVIARADRRPRLADASQDEWEFNRRAGFTDGGRRACPTAWSRTRSAPAEGRLRRPAGDHRAAPRSAHPGRATTSSRSKATG